MTFSDTMHLVGVPAAGDEVMPSEHTLTVSVDVKPSPDLAAITGCLDKLGLALVGHHHQWTDDERTAYERAVAVLERLVEVK